MANIKRIKAYYALIAQWQREGTHTPKAILMELFKLYANQPPRVILKGIYSKHSPVPVLFPFSFFDSKLIKPIRTQKTFIKKNIPLLAATVTLRELVHFLLNLDNELSTLRLKSYDFEDDLHILLIALFIDYPHIFPAIQFKAMPNPNIKVDESSNFQDKRPLSVLKNCWVAARLFQQKIAYKDLQYILSHTNGNYQLIKPFVNYISSFRYLQNKNECMPTDDLLNHDIETTVPLIKEEFQNKPNFQQALCDYFQPGLPLPRLKHVIIKFSLIKEFAQQLTHVNINEIFAIIVEHYRDDFHTNSVGADPKVTFVSTASVEATEIIDKILLYLITLTDINKLFETTVKNLDHFLSEAVKQYKRSTFGGYRNTITSLEHFRNSFSKRRAIFKALDLFIPLINRNHLNIILKILNNHLRSDIIFLTLRDAVESASYNIDLKSSDHLGFMEKIKDLYNLPDNCIAALKTLTTLLPLLSGHDRQDWIPFLLENLRGYNRNICYASLKAISCISSLTIDQEKAFLQIVLKEAFARNEDGKPYDFEFFQLASDFVISHFIHISNNELLDFFLSLFIAKSIKNAYNQPIKLDTQSQYLATHAYVKLILRNSQENAVGSLVAIIKSDHLKPCHTAALVALLKKISQIAPDYKSHILDSLIEKLDGEIHHDILDIMPNVIQKITSSEVSRIFQSQLNVVKSFDFSIVDRCKFDVLRLLIPSLSNTERESLLSECQFTLNHINSNQFLAKLDILSHLIPHISIEACNDMQHSLIAYLIRLCDKPDNFIKERWHLIQVLKRMGVFLTPELMEPNISILFEIINNDENVISLIAAWTAFIPSLRLPIISELRALSNLENQRYKVECLTAIYHIRQHTDTDALSHNYFSSFSVPKDVCDIVIKYSRI